MTATCEDRSTAGQLRAMATDSVRRARAKIDGTDTCADCLAVADTWYRNLPRPRTRHWPGVCGSPFSEIGKPRSTFELVAEWDVKNYEQIAHILNICRAAGHARAA
jgi:hypothetical protein